MKDRNARRRLTGKEKHARDLEVLRFARRGWTNAQIGMRVGLHADTVSRIVQRQLRQSRQTPKAEAEIAAHEAASQLQRFTERLKHVGALPVPASDPRANVLRFALEVPWEEAEAVQRHLGFIANTIGQALAARAELEGERLAVRAASETKLENQKRAFQVLAIVAGNEIRQRQKQRGLNAPRSHAVAQIAASYGLSGTVLTGIVNKHRAAICERIRKRRQAEVIHLYFAGLSHDAITRRTGLGRSAVAGILRREKDLIATMRRLSLGLDPSEDRER